VTKNKCEKRTLSDYYFVKQIDSDIANYYKQAIGQTVAECYPDALVNYRRALSLLVDKTCEALGIKYLPLKIELDRRIKKLSTSERIHIHSTDLMNKIRVAGNKGTHSDNYPKVDFEELNKITQAHFLNLLKKLFRIINKSAEVPDFDETLKDEMNITKLSHKALFERDPEAQYLVAKKLNMNVHRLLKDSSLGVSTHPTFIKLKNGNVVKRFHYTESATNASIAFQLLEDSANYNPDALYEYAKMKLADGDWITINTINTNYIESAIEDLKIATKHNVTKAMSLLGQIYLHGLYGAAVDIDVALELLEKSAEQSEPEATFQLANYYLKSNKFEEAFKYFNMSASLGSPKAKFFLAKNIIDGVFIDKKNNDVEQLLDEAWDAEVIEVGLYQAERLALKSGDCFCEKVFVAYKEFFNKIYSANELDGGYPLLSAAKEKTLDYLIKHKGGVGKAYQYMISTEQCSEEKGVQYLIKVLHGKVDIEQESRRK
jgi:TPR repeat protein